MKDDVDVLATQISHTENTEKPGLISLQLGDVGAQVVDVNNVHHVTPEENRKVLRRVDMFILPLLFISYGLQFMDKGLLGNAAQFGIIEDLHLYDVKIVNGVEKQSLIKFSYATLIFYWGFVAGCLPTAYLAQRFPIGKFCAAAIVIWGGITMATAGVTSYAGIMVQRFFLGFVESAIPPAFSLITAMWYKPNEQPLRHCIWISASGFFALVGSIAVWGIGHIQGALSPWQYQYLILGAVTIAWGILLIFMLPDNPVSAKILSKEQKLWAVERMREGQTGIESRKFKAYQVKEALLDVKTWAFVVVTFCVEFTNGAVSGFGSIIVNSFGYSHFKSVLINGAMGSLIFVILLLSGLAALYIRNQRCNIAALTCLPIVMGAAIVWKGSWDSRSLPLFGWFCFGFFVTPYVMILAVMTSNTAGYTKRAFTTAIVWGAYCTTNGVAPLVIKATEVDEHYPSLTIPLIVLLSFSVVVIMGLRVYLQLLNRKRDQMGIGDLQEANRTAFADLTDKENPNFRYTW